METAASNSREDVTEIDLFELFWSVMAKWRRILVWALIFSLVIGGAGVVSGLLDINDADNLTMTQGQYALLLDTYNLSKSTLNARLRTLNQEVAQLQDYQKQSALYAIDPYHTHVLEVAFFVDTGYEILPENNYQSMDYTPAIVLAYRSALEHLNVESLLAEKRGDSAAIDNIGGIGFLSFSVEAVEPPLQSASSSSSSTKTTSSSLTDNIFVESGLIRMQIFGADAEQTDEILALVESTIRELQPQLSKNVHAHSITLVSSTAYDTMASSLIQLHDTIDTSMDELSERLNGTILAYNALTIPQTPKTTTTEVLFRTGVKFLVIGFVVGAFLGFLFYGCAYVLSAVLDRLDHVSQRWSSPILGVYVNGKGANRLDRWIARHRDLDHTRTEAQSSSIVAANVRQLAQGEKTLLLAGSIDKAQIAELAKKLSPQLEGMALVPSGNICSDSESIHAMGDCDAVILVEQLGRTHYAELEREIEKLNYAGKKLLGLILIGNVRG